MLDLRSHRPYCILQSQVKTGNSLAQPEVDSPSMADHRSPVFAHMHTNGHTAHPPRSQRETYLNGDSCVVSTCIDQTRLEHESPIIHLTGSNQAGDATDDENMEEHDQPILPAFVNHLTNRLEALGLNPHDNDFDLPVRTWYIDHRTIHRWTAPQAAATCWTTTWMGSTDSIHLG